MTRDTPIATRPGPLTVEDKVKLMAPPIRTPPRQIARSEYNKFTPFHDIKKDIDALIDELPADFADLVKTDNEIVIERLEARHSTQLSLYLYSPSKKPLGHRKRHLDCDRSLGHDVLDERVRVVSLEHTQATDCRSVGQTRNKSLLKRARNQLKKAIMLIIPHVRAHEEDSGTSDTKRADFHPRRQATTWRQKSEPQISWPKPAMNDRSFAKLPINHGKRNLSLPVITISETFRPRSPEDITSTLRKPLPTRHGHRHAVVIQKSPRRLPKINEVPGRQIQPHSPPRIQSQAASICDIMALEHELALADAPIAVKAAASMCLMAIAAGADFMVQDDLSRTYTREVRVRRGKAAGSRGLQEH
ncbi:hypothetical protein Slin15195_G023530 [Septoria linicola]|uniref:Uncharacterized protein n=1 Tax=Septoria linicola TaxID=215465 RepID=A0A9Q9EGL3_9PEZI|nr:hypothetical protein Slin14017_G022610 [Septoria linicola]USW49034.1 hypothetical protein Slin15195_G023530 [Septoria linicola]